MCCVVVLVILLFPRVALIVMWLTTNDLQRAFHGGMLLPLLGFIFLPLTTIVYAWMVSNGFVMAGVNLIWIVLAVLIDLGAIGGGGYHRSRR